MGSSTDKTRSVSPPSFYKPAPAEIVHGPMRFLITDRPSDYNMAQYLTQLREHNVVCVVRVCEPSYNVDKLQKEGIQVLDWEFSDGSPPPQEIREKWIAMLRQKFKSEPGACIAVHCVAGLGRAPVLVALALMEAGMKYEDAVENIRAHRRGAINQKQLTFLEKYKATGELKKIKNKEKNGKDCCIM